ncbi:MAG: type I 3-dehydroquinate dehydratase [Patescibacteria group bacterium]
MKIRVCIPIRERSSGRAISFIKKAEKSADIIEIWLEQISDIDLKKLIKASKKPILAKGGFDLLKQAISAGARYVDLDIGERDLAKKVRLLQTLNRRAEVIVSYHNFQKTPSIDELVRTAKRVYSAGADIVKVATNIKKVSDISILLELLARMDGKKMICIGMGERGRLTRIMLSVAGSFLTYVALDSRHRTAPGQYTLKEFQKALINYSCL